MFLGLDVRVWMMLGGAALLAGSLMVVNRFDLAKRGPFVSLMSNDGHRFPAAAAIVLGLAGGALFFLGMRG